MNQREIEEAAKKLCGCFMCTPDDPDYDSDCIKHAFRAGAALVMERNKELEAEIRFYKDLCRNSADEVGTLNRIIGIKTEALKKPCPQCGRKQLIVTACEAGPSATGEGER